MVERPHTDPYPHVHNVAHGRPPLGDGSNAYPTVYLTPRVRRWGMVAYVAVGVILLASVLYGVLS